jgi:hypothetical protein
MLGQRLHQALELWQEEQPARVHLAAILLQEEEEWDLEEECPDVDLEEPQEEDLEVVWLEVAQDSLHQLLQRPQCLE